MKVASIKLDCWILHCVKHCLMHFWIHRNTTYLPSWSSVMVNNTEMYPLRNKQNNLKNQGCSGANLLSDLHGIKWKECIHVLCNICKKGKSFPTRKCHPTNPEFFLFPALKMVSNLYLEKLCRLNIGILGVQNREALRSCEIKSKQNSFYNLYNSESLLLREISLWFDVMSFEKCFK